MSRLSGLQSSPHTSSSSSSSSSNSTNSNRDSALKDSTSGRRARIACDACRKRRTKCSGLPGPCVLCKQHDTFCHFHPHLDARKKDSVKSGDSSKRQELILSGILLALRFNSEAQIHDLLQILRSPTASALDISRSLLRQLCLVQSKTGAQTSHVTEDDILSLALPSVVNCRAVPGDDCQDDHTMGTEFVQPSNTSHTPSALADHTSNASSSPRFLETADGHAQRKRNLVPNFQYQNQGIVPDKTLLHQDTSIISNVLGAQGSDLDAFAVSNSADLKLHELMSDPEADFLHPSSTAGLHSPQLQDFLILDQLVDSQRSSWPLFDLPLSMPYSDLGRLCMDLRDAGRQLLAQGITLQDLGCHGLMDCELLFRDRAPHDAMSIPNWACEVARRLPPLCPSTRIAIALCIFRMMPYLLQPCQATWDMLPPALRPTQHQFQYSHDITISFLPIPTLRTLLVQNSVDWLKYASQHDLRLSWPGAWGDVGGASLTEVGNWREMYPSSSKRRATNLTPLPLVCDTTEPQQTMLEAVTRDSSSGRRCVSADFERHCWNPENWQFGKGILSIWPNLENQIQSQTQAG